MEPAFRGDVTSYSVKIPASAFGDGNTLTLEAEIEHYDDTKVDTNQGFTMGTRSGNTQPVTATAHKGMYDFVGLTVSSTDAEKETTTYNFTISTITE